MGAFRSRIEALGARQFYDGSDNLYSPDAGYNYVRPTFGVSSEPFRASEYSQQPSLVKTETNPHVPGAFFMTSAIGPWGLNGSGATTPELGTLTFTARLERGGTMGPPYVTPDVLTDGGTAYEAITGDRASSNGFLVVDFRRGTGDGGSVPIGFWDLHITANDTIGVATHSDDGWGDLRIDYPAINTQDRWGRRKCYVFDTGFPADELFDGRPHLITVRFRSQSQINPDASPALPQDNWIKVSIDGTNLPATTRGPALTGGQASVLLTGNTYAFDEVAFWDRDLSDAEVSSMWGSTVWGEDTWPYTGGGLSSGSTGHAETIEALTRVVDWEPQWSGPRLPQELQFGVTGTGIDPVWEQDWADQDATAVDFLGDHHAGMGEATYEGTDPWSSSWGARQADRWLDDQSVALIGAPVNGSTTASGDLLQDDDELVGVSPGQTSVVGDLTVVMVLQPAPISGGSTVYAITISDLTEFAGQAAGTSSVSGDLAHGQTEHLSGSSAGTGTAIADLTVSRWTSIGGEEVDDFGRPMGSGLRRGFFSPKSVGYVNERTRTQAYGTGTITAGPGS